MKPKVYIETSVVSYLTSRPSRDLVVAAHQEITRQWWEERSDEFDLFVSDIVMEEAQKGDKNASSARLNAISTLPVLITDDLVISFTQKLISAGLVPYTV
ncbi:MAG TPA: hypothetical protein ENN29_11500 [Candidatus Hydrogenedentes bacterium]|nr:hypothetical protein [Candidatus Hydrogenedentota bacterium]